ncbi:MAG: hypothetical protein KAR42_11040 [candidate division Zixibacteria bacterium]|nr:hypothetical protein [candidate division Zixibacteria bacterium]
MAGLDMSGHIDDTFQSTGATRYSSVGGAYVNGRYVDGTETVSPHKVNLQPATIKQIEALNQGGERVVDVRNVYVNDGELYKISQADEWVFVNVDGRFKCHSLDSRPWRNYCRAVVSRIDGSV